MSGLSRSVCRSAILLTLVMASGFCCTGASSDVLLVAAVDAQGRVSGLDPSSTAPGWRALFKFPADCLPMAGSASSGSGVLWWVDETMQYSASSSLRGAPTVHRFPELQPKTIGMNSLEALADWGPERLLVSFDHGLLTMSSRGKRLAVDYSSTPPTRRYVVANGRVTGPSRARYGVDQDTATGFGWLQIECVGKSLAWVMSSKEEPDADPEICAIDPRLHQKYFVRLARRWYLGAVPEKGNSVLLFSAPRGGKNDEIEGIVCGLKGVEAPPFAIHADGGRFARGEQLSGAVRLSGGRYAFLVKQPTSGGARDTSGSLSLVLYRPEGREIRIARLQRPIARLLAGAGDSLIGVTRVSDGHGVCRIDPSTGAVRILAALPPKTVDVTAVVVARSRTRRPGR